MLLRQKQQQKRRPFEFVGMAHDMKTLALRLLPTARVNTVSPGDILIEGGWWSQVQEQDLQAFTRELSRNPMNRMLQPKR